MWKKKMACALAVVALCGTMAASAANYTILEKAEKVETTVYGTTQTGSVNDRIIALNKTLNGPQQLSGSVQQKTDQLYTDVYGNTGSDLSLLAAVNLMQWQYSGEITEEPLLARVDTIEESLNGKASTGSLKGRVNALRSQLLGNTKYTSETVTIPTGTIVTLKNRDTITSEHLEEGDTVRFIVADDVVVGDVVAIPKGMETDGTVTKARKAGRFGRNGKVEITYDSVRGADGTPVPLTIGEKTKEQYKKAAGAVGASAAGAIIFGPVGLVGGLFVKGDNVNIPAGSTLYCETKEDTTVVGFVPKGTLADTKTADMAASGVDVASSHHEETAAAAGDAEMTQADATPVVHEVASQEEVTPVSLDEENDTHDDDIQATVSITPTNE